MLRLLVIACGAASAAAQGLWAELNPAVRPSARSHHAMTLEPTSQDVLLFGGQAAGSSLLYADLWQWSGTNWIQIPASGALFFGRRDCGLCSDGNGGLFLFGGYVDVPFVGAMVRNDMWRFQQGTWTQLQAVLSPPARQRHALVRTAQGALLFGGSDAFANTFGDTWLWNGSVWTQLFPASSPSARGGHGMVFDSARNIAVLFGGRTGGPITTVLADTWEFDGSTWLQRSPSHSPPAREHAAMAFSEATGETMLFGGNGNGATWNDTWTWHGVDWQQRNTTGSMPPRSASAMVFASGTQGAVLFGGLATGVDDATYRFVDSPATFTPMGSGCIGPTGLTPTLAGAPDEVPRLGTTTYLRVGNLPASLSIAALMLGLSNVSSGGVSPYPLPFDLGVLGWPGCQQLVSIDSTMLLITSGAFVDAPFVVPMNLSLIDFTFYAQAIVLYSPTGVAVTNGLTAVVGT